MCRPDLSSALVVLIVCLVTDGCAEVEPGAPARVAFGATVFDAGHVQQGDRVEHAFVFRNSGDRDLRITRIRASCDCVAVKEIDSVVPGGATAEIAASLDTAGLFGDVRRTIAVFTNDPSSPAVLLKLEAEVDFTVAANPRRLYVGRVRPGDDARTFGRVVLDGGAEVTAVGSDGAVITPHLVEPAAGSVPAPERRFRIHIQEQAPAGPFTEAVTVRTTSRATPSLTIPVTGVVEGKS